MSGESPPDRGRAIAATALALLVGGALVGIIFVFKFLACGGIEPSPRTYCTQFGHPPFLYYVRNWSPLLIVLVGSAIGIWRCRIWPVAVFTAAAIAWTAIVVTVLGAVPGHLYR